MESSWLWGRLREAVSRPDEGRVRLWAWLREKLDLAQYRPQAVPDTVLSRLEGREGPYYVLKNPATKTYYRLSDRDYFLWQLMDGSRTVKDLVVAYFLEYGSFAFARVATLVSGLKASLLLRERPVYVYRQARYQMERRRLTYKVNQVWRAFFQKQFAIRGLDGAIGAAYRYGGRLLFTWPLQVLYILVSMVGLVLFVRAFNAGSHLLVTMAGSIALGFLALLALQLVGIFFHEMAHALTVKHYGREVRRAGVMIYLGLPAFFVDTTDIWLENKRARLSVTWAGPYSGLVLAGLASIGITLSSNPEIDSLLFKFAFLAYLTVFFNLNPLLELDGYYLLMDWLEIPLLRYKSLAFIRTGLSEKVKGIDWRKGPKPLDHAQVGWGSKLRSFLDSFSREEKIFTIFGLLSGAWTVYAIYLGASLWQKRLAGALGNLWTQGGGVGKMLMSLGAVAISLLFVLAIGLSLLSFARRGLAWAAKKGLFASTWNLAAIFLVTAVALALAPGTLGYPALIPIIGLVALAAGTYFAWRNAVDYTGSHLATVFWLLGLFSLALLLRETGVLLLDQQILRGALPEATTIGLGYLAYALLALASLLLFANTDLRELRLAEKLLLALGLVACYGLVLWFVGGRREMGTSTANMLLALTTLLVPLLALTLTVPTLFSFWRTGFGPAWASLALAFGGLTAVALLGWTPLLPYFFLAGGLLLFHLAFRYVTLLEDQPAMTLELSDGRRLQRAFGWTASAVFAQFRQIGGERPARVLAERFNNYALAAHWRVSLVGGRAQDSLPWELDLIERGRVYAAALNLLLDLVAEEIGEKLTVRALQRAYDRLPWEEREIGGQYLFREVTRAEALNREFLDIQRDYQSLLRRMPLFATMDQDEIDLLCSRLRAEHFPPGREIVRQGEAGDRFYVVERGHVEVTQRDGHGVSEVVNQLDRGDYFGELALLRDAPRNATCTATVPTQLLSLSREHFDQLVRSRFILREKVDHSIARVDLLRRIPLFDELDAQQIRLIAAQLQEERYEPGEAIIRQGEIGEAFYVIESGRVQVSVLQDRQQKAVVERGPGEYVGEIALLLKVPRTATVTALTQVRVLALYKEDFDQLVVEHLYVSRRLEQETSRRMMDLRRAA